MKRIFKMKKYFLFLIITVFSFNAKLFAQDDKRSTEIIKKEIQLIKERLEERGLNEAEIESILKQEESRISERLIAYEVEQEKIVAAYRESFEMSSNESEKKEVTSKSTTSSCVPLSEKNALLALLANTEIPSMPWVNKQGWSANNEVQSYYMEDANGNDLVVNGQKVINPNGWYGVKVRDCHVVKIDLHNNALRLQLPNISALQHLYYLDLSGNYMNELHNSNIGNINTLQHLDLENNMFGYGPNGNLQTLLPFVNLTNLYFLNLGRNSFTGSIPSSISNLTHLSYLNLAENNLSGDIPSSMSSLTNLAFLNLNKYSKWFIYTQEANTTITHPIPSNFGNLINLIYLNLDGCGLRNNLNVLGGLHSLQTLSISENKFINALPSSFTGLTSLKYFYAYSNKLEDISVLGNLNSLNVITASDNILNTYLSSFSSLTNLTSLTLSYNNLVLFPNISNSNNLNYLYLQFNSINQNLPSFINNLTVIKEIDFSNNQIPGQILQGLFNKSQLQRLNLSVNKLNGTIPPVINLPYLFDLQLHQNSLSGSVPVSFQNISSLTHLSINNNQLSGTIPNLTVISSLKKLYIQNNQFRFIDFVNQFNHYLNFNNTGTGSYQSFICSPQAPIDEEIYITKTVGSSVTFTMYEAPDTRYLNDDTFQWYKGSSSIGAGEASGNRQITLTNLSISDSGNYTCISRHHSPAISDANSSITYGYSPLSLQRKVIHLTVVPPPPCYDCSSFDLIKNSKYLVSGWVKEEDPSTPEKQYKNYLSSIKITFTDIDGVVITANQVDPINGVVIPGNPEFFATGEIIDGWQRIVGEFVVPSNVDDMQLELINKNATGTMAYFDDIRVLPSNGNMKSFVYDQKTQRLMAELDENNYSTFYEYDLEGGLIRIKKETEKGVFTIQETRSGNFKK